MVCFSANPRHYGGVSAATSWLLLSPILSYEEPGSNKQAKRSAADDACSSYRHESPRPLTIIPVIVPVRLIILVRQFSSGTSSSDRTNPSSARTGMFHGVEHPRHARDHSTLLRA
jgi:hypothetical protein